MQNQMQKFILAVLVKNNANVLARVASLFGRRGFNIESLTVSTTTDPKISRMSIIVYGDEQTLEQILRNMCGAELVHETIMVLSLVPIGFSRIFGELPVFLATSLAACLFDGLFVMAQRYNRPRLVRLAQKRK